MPNHRIEEKMTKTALLLVLSNLILAPLYVFDSKLGLAASLILTARLLHKMHQLGQARRPGANVVNGLQRFFSSQFHTESGEIENTGRNIINGGEALLDEISNAFKF